MTKTCFVQNTKCTIIRVDTECQKKYIKCNCYINFVTKAGFHYCTSIGIRQHTHRQYSTGNY